VTTAWNPCGDERGRLSHQLHTRYQILGHRRARRMSQRFARVGIEAPPVRLQQMLAGMPVTQDEATDIQFALIATQMERDDRSAKFKRLQRQGTRSMLFAGLILLVLNFLFCVAYVMLNLTDQAPPL
jgi:hypothetical protein